VRRQARRRRSPKHSSVRALERACDSVVCGHPHARAARSCRPRLADQHERIAPTAAGVREQCVDSRELETSSDEHRLRSDSTDALGAASRSAPRLTSDDGIARVRPRRWWPSSTKYAPPTSKTLIAGMTPSGNALRRFASRLRESRRYSARSVVTLKSSLWRSSASMAPSNSPMRTMPLKNGASSS
jgi:hypothetical protein